MPQHLHYIAGSPALTVAVVVALVAVLAALIPAGIRITLANGRKAEAEDAAMARELTALGAIAHAIAGTERSES